MKKKVLLILAVFSFFLANVSATPVTRTEALAKAQDFMQARGAALKGELSAVNGPRKVGNAQDETSCYYVFNNGQDGGFVIVSGDSRTKEILAYSDKGTFDPNDMPPSMVAMLDNYTEEINKLGEDTAENQSSGNGPRHVAGSHAYPAILPLLTSEWNQTTPFNSTCPLVSGERCAAGCVAVAMAQIIYYYRSRMPAKTEVEIAGYTSNGATTTTKKAGTAYNWSYMWDKYNYNLSSTQISAVANLILYAGMSVKSNYSTSNTGANCTSVPTAMSTYFGFSSNAKLVNRSNYTTAQWEDMLISELMSARPVFYNGVSYSMNHAFIIDGYDGVGYYHVNWGWGGRFDGYYCINILNPESDFGQDAQVDGDSCDSKQQAIFDLQPVTGYFEIEDTPELTSTINSAKSTAVTVTYKNNTNTTASFKCGLGYADADGIPQLLKEWDDGWVEVPAKTSLGAVAFTLATTDFSKHKLKTGTYELFPIYLREGEEDWDRCANSTANYISATYATSSVTASLGTYTYSLKASDFYFSGSKTKSYTQPVHFTLTNEGGNDYYGTLYLFASTTSTPGSYQSKVPVMLGPGQSVNVLMSFKPSAASTYNVWIARDTSCKYILGSSTVKISTGSYKRALKVTSVTVENANPSKTKQIFSNKIKGTAKIANIGTNTYSDKLQLFIFRKKSGGSYTAHYSSVKTITVEQGDTIDVDFEFDNLSDLYYYNISFYYWVDWAILTNGIWKDYYLSPCVMTYDSKGNLTGTQPSATFTVPASAAAVDLTDQTATVTKVVPNSNPNTLYYVGESETAPTGLSGKNVIKGSSATSISLTDGYPFYAPKEFVAKSVSYSRTPQIGTNGSGGWEILVMPFAATKVTGNSRELHWFKSDEDQQKDFWIKEFSSIQGYETVCFDYAQQIEANKPYIMAVPGTRWGDYYNLIGKKMVFSATNATIPKTLNVVTGSNVYAFRGSFSEKHKVASYVLDSTGKKFVFKTAEIAPFRGYFISTSSDVESYSYSNLNIASETGVRELTMTPFGTDGDMVDVYNLNGVKVSTVRVNNGSISLEGLQNGIYIVNGHKLIK